MLQARRAEIEEKVCAGCRGHREDAGRRRTNSTASSGESISVKISRPLPHTNQPPRVTGVVASVAAARRRSIRDEVASAGHGE